MRSRHGVGEEARFHRQLHRQRHPRRDRRHPVHPPRGRPVRRQLRGPCRRAHPDRSPRRALPRIPEGVRDTEGRAEGEAREGHHGPAPPPRGPLARGLHPVVQWDQGGERPGGPGEAEADERGGGHVYYDGG